MSTPPLARELGLAPHPEGGWFRRTWTSSVCVTLADGRVRPTATLIWFLLPAGESSAWHRVASNETWLAHVGIVDLELGGTAPRPVRAGSHRLGCDLAAGERPQVVVPAGCWQRTLPAAADALVSCLVSPGFDFADFELAWATRPARARRITPVLRRDVTPHGETFVHMATQPRGIAVV